MGEPIPGILRNQPVSMLPRPTQVPRTGKAQRVFKQYGWDDTKLRYLYDPC